MSVNSIFVSLRSSRFGASAMIDFFEASVILRIAATSAWFSTACVTKAVVLITESDFKGKSLKVSGFESGEFLGGRLVDV